MQLKLDPNANLKPTMPPCAVEGYVGSVILLDLLKIPAEIGNVTVTGVRVAATYPDNSTATVDCSKETDGTWSCTLPATPTSGRVANGVQFLVDGKTPSGDIVTGYVLAITELAVYTRDMTVDSGGTSWIFHFFDTPPATPKKCDTATIDGALKYYNGSAWVDFANVDLSNYATKADLSYDIVSPTVTPGTPGWSSNYAQVYNMYGELVDVSLPNRKTESTPDGDKTGWFWLNPEMVYILLSEDESATSLTADWNGFDGEDFVEYHINFSKTSPASATLTDRATNSFAASNVTTLTLTPPPRAVGKSRDFYIAANAGAAVDLAINVSGALLFNPDMSAVSLRVPAGAARTWRLRELANGAGTLIPAAFVVTGANQQNALGFTPENAANKVTSLSAQSTNTQYPSAKCVYDALAGKLSTNDATAALAQKQDRYTAWTVAKASPEAPDATVEWMDGYWKFVSGGEVVAASANDNPAATSIDDGVGTYSASRSAIIDGKQAKITASGILQGDGSGGVTAATVDSTPTANSANLVTSGGVKAALDSIDVKPTRIYNAAGTDALDDKGQLYKSSTIRSGNCFEKEVNGTTTTYAYDSSPSAFYDGKMQTVYRYKIAGNNNTFTYVPSNGKFIADNGGWELATFEKEKDPTVVGTEIASSTTGWSFTPLSETGDMDTAPYAHLAVESVPTRTIAANKAYAIGDILGDSGKAYRCKSAYTSASSSPTAPSSDTTNWEEIPVLAQKANAADLAYSFNVATVSSGTTPTVTTVADRAINSATLGSTVTAATVTLPAAVSGRSRDFFIDLTIEASTAPIIEFIDPATGTTANVTFGADALADIDTGDNLALWTELPNNRWLVNVKHEEASS